MRITSSSQCFISLLDHSFISHYTNIVIINSLQFIEIEDVIYFLSCVARLFDFHKGTCLRQLFSFENCKQRLRVVKFDTALIKQKWQQTSNIGLVLIVDLFVWFNLIIMLQLEIIKLVVMFLISESGNHLFYHQH